MHKFSSSLLLLLIAMIALVLGYDIQQVPEKVVAKDKVVVSRVIDGDTVEILTAIGTDKIRLIGVDTTEKGECYFQEAKDYLADVLENREVTIESDPTQDNRDKYHRLLRYIYLPDGTNIAEDLIKNGYGYEYTYEKPYFYQDLYKTAQDYAETNQLGVYNSQSCS